MAEVRNTCPSVMINILKSLGPGAIGIGTLIRHSSMAGPRTFRFPKSGPRRTPRGTVWCGSYFTKPCGED